MVVKRQRDYKYLLILPAYNEEGKIGTTVKRAKEHFEHVFVADDASSDKTAEEAREAGAIVVTHDVNKGVGAGIRTGIDYAIEHDFPVCVVMGGDNQDDPAEHYKHLDAIDWGYDVVQGSRYIHEDSRDFPLFRKLTTKAFTKFFQYATWSKCTDASNGYRAFRTDVVKQMNLWRDELNRYELEPYMLIQATKRFKYYEVPVQKYYPKGVSYSKMKPFVSWWRISKPMVKEVFRLNK